MGLPSITTIDKALVTGLGFVITVGGLVAKWGGYLHLPASWTLIAAGVVGVATTLMTYLAKGPEQAAREIAARKTARAQAKAAKATTSVRRTARPRKSAVKAARKPPAKAKPVVVEVEHDPPAPHAPGVVEVDPPGKHTKQ